MKISTRGRYALEALTDMVIHAGAGFENAKSIAARRDMSLHYLEQLFRTLRNSGLIESARGPTGGYRLKVNPSEVSVLQVLNTMEGDLFEVNCKDDPLYQCPFAGKCAAHLIWDQIHSGIVNTLGSISLQQLVNQTIAAQRTFDFDYCI